MPVVRKFTHKSHPTIKMQYTENNTAVLKSSAAANEES